MSFWQPIFSLFTTAGRTNWLAIALYATIIGYFGLNQFEAWQAQRQAVKQTEAITERCTQDVINRNEIEQEARDAINNDHSNSFINQ